MTPRTYPSVGLIHVSLSHANVGSFDTGKLYQFVFTWVREVKRVADKQEGLGFLDLNTTH